MRRVSPPFLLLLSLSLTLGLLPARFASAQNATPCPPDQFVPVWFSVPHPCPGVPLQLRADACAPCVDLQGFVMDPASPLRLRAEMDLRNCLLTVCMPESVTVGLGVFAPGHHEITVEVVGRIVQSDGSVCNAVRRQVVAFDVPLACPPPPDPLPFVDFIHIGPPAPCLTCPPPEICADSPIPFEIAGHFPDDCYEFRGIELMPSPLMIPTPQPPIARVIVAVNDCLARPCAQVIVPWRASAMLPGLPAGDYRMMVEVAEVSWCDPANVPLAIHRTSVPFKVGEPCIPPPGEGCLLANWRHAPPDAACDAKVAPGVPAKLVFQLDTSPALSALKGRIALLPPALRITHMRAIGAAAGMKLGWQALRDGASFALYSDDGALIPPTGLCRENVPCPSQPVLEVTVSALPGMPPPALTLARMVALEALDAHGNPVAMCPTFAPVDMVARICAAPPQCDANGDGRADVRDLAWMVRCLRAGPLCPDSLRARFDCDGDSIFTLDDVRCCARRILHGPLPVDAACVPLARLRMDLGEPVATVAGFDRTLRLSGADGLGAARLALAFPSDVALTGVELAGDPAGWLHIEEMGAVTGEALLALIPIAPGVASELDVVLHFTRSPGAGPGGTVAIADADFVDPEGVIVEPASGVLGVADRPRARLMLSTARPNPFTREVRFELSLAAEADVRLEIYDLSGRLVSSLHRGPLGPGVHPFAWDGTWADGARAADGVYFVRARAGGELSNRRLVLMRGR